MPLAPALTRFNRVHRAVLGPPVFHGEAGSPRRDENAHRARDGSCGGWPRAGRPDTEVLHVLLRSDVLPSRPTPHGNGKAMRQKPGRLKRFESSSENLYPIWQIA